MDILVIAGCGLLGLIIGSFLNVVIYRVPAGESVVSPPSRCPGCGRQIRPGENIPVLSWLLLRGKCRGCGMSISARYPGVELLTGVAFAITAWRIGLDWSLPAYLYLVAVGIALAFIDLDTRRLPNALTLPSYPVGAGLLLIGALGEGDLGAFWRALAGGVALFAFYFLLAVVYPAGMGFGDVKLAGVLGLYLAYLSWGTLLLGGFLGFLIGALIGVGLILFRGGGRKTMLPFGPSMILGALLAIWFGEPVIDWYAGLLT